MWRYLLHLWATPPIDEPLRCPPSPSGQALNALGTFDNGSVANAYGLSAAVSAGIVIVAVLLCYLATRKTLGPGFKVRWWFSLGSTAALCFPAVWLLLRTAPTFALAGSCESNPAAFAETLPMSVILSRSAAAFVWGALAFIAFSWLCTFTVGRWAALHNGFFHNREWPWPRALSVK